MLHPPDALSTLPAECLVGQVDPATLPPSEETMPTNYDLQREIARQQMPPARNMLVVQDFEDWAERVLTDTAWAYYRSASDEERSKLLLVCRGILY
jgi:L-lactate dehydrogenase (cytochrome)